MFHFADTVFGCRAASGLRQAVKGYQRRKCILVAVFVVFQVTSSAAQTARLSADSMVHSSKHERSHPQRIFISGHSLTDQPIPRYVAAIAESLGRPLSWNRQYLEGSSIKQRSRGGEAGTPQWSGYSQGIDDRNEPVNVLAEFQKPSRHPDQPYDALLITEQHALLGSLVWNDTVFHLRSFQDRFAAHSTAGITYFYEPWLSLDNKSDPKRWIAYERAAAPVWECIVSQLNQTIGSEGRKDRLVRIPAALALAELIERATATPGVPAVTQSSVRSTVDSLLRDNVHLTPLGAYYVALVTVAVMLEKSPEGAWHPSEVTDRQAAALQRFVAEFVSQQRPTALTLSDCRRYVVRSFLWTFLGYIDAAVWRNEMGYFRSLYLRSKLAAQWMVLFLRDGVSNPFDEAAYKRR